MALFFFAGLVVIVAVQFGTGRVGGGARSFTRDRNPQVFWIWIAFEIVMLLALAFGIISGLAR